MAFFSPPTTSTSRGISLGRSSTLSSWHTRRSGTGAPDLGLARLALLTEPSNHESQRLAERSGFQQEGILRSYAEIVERRVDYVVFSLLPSDVDSDVRN